MGKQSHEMLGQSCGEPFILSVVLLLSVVFLVVFNDRQNQLVLIGMVCLLGHMHIYGTILLALVLYHFCDLGEMVNQFQI